MSKKYSLKNPEKKLHLHKAQLLNGKKKEYIYSL